MALSSLSGQWFGFYTYHGYAKRFLMDLVLEFWNGKMTGDGETLREAQGVEELHELASIMLFLIYANAFSTAFNACFLPAPATISSHRMHEG